MSYLRRFQLTDTDDVPAIISDMGSLSVHELFRLAGGAFIGTTIDTSFWTSTVSGAGAANTQAAGIVTAASGTANSGYASLVSTQKSTFLYAHPNRFRAHIRIPTVVVALNTRIWGAISATGTPLAPVDGFYFSLSAAGVLSIVSCAGSSATAVASGSFNGEVASYVVNTNVHLYEIQFYVNLAKFYIDGVLIHTVTPTTVQLAQTYTLPITFQSSNSAAGVTSGTIEIWASAILREGREASRAHYIRVAAGSTGAIYKYGPGVLRAIHVSAVSANAVVTIYDNTAASAPVMYTTGAMPALTQPFSIDFKELNFFTGLYVDRTGANCALTTVFE